MNEKLFRELEELYNKLNRSEYIHPDPVEFLHRYDSVEDREIVGLIASTLAYGRVSQILRSVEDALARMKPGPREFIIEKSEGNIRRAFTGFKHRFTTGDQLAGLIISVKKTIEKFGSLNVCFLSGYDDKSETIVPAIENFNGTLASFAENISNFLFPSPSMGSACKRLNLYVKWLVRKDEVDPGGWKGIPREKLIVPLDTHMFRICGALGLTKRKQPNLKTALEITSEFRKINPSDPTKYDFALTRLGIRDDCDLDEFLERCYGD